MARSFIPRRTSIYKLIEEQRQDLKNAGKHLLYKELDGVNSDIEDPDEEYYEVVVVIPCKGFHIIEPLIDFLEDRLPQLIIHKKSFAGHKKIGLFIRSDDKYLIQTAQMLGMKINISRGMAKLSSQQRQTIIKYYLDSLRYLYSNSNSESSASTTTTSTNITSTSASTSTANLPCSSSTTTNEKYHIKIPGVKFQDGEAILYKLIKLNLIESVFPIHSRVDLNELRCLWVSSFLSPQPLDLIRKYFGFRIAMYFAFLGHYTKWLFFPAILGLLVTIFSNDLLTLIYSIAIFIWSVLYLKSLDSYCHNLSQSWSDDEIGSLEVANFSIRPGFNGQVIYEGSSDKIQVIYPEWRRKVIKYAVTLPTIIFSLISLFYIMFYALEFQTYWDDKLIAHFDYPSWSSWVPKILFAIVSALLDAIYYRIAVWLNCQENYPFELTHENSLISKLIIFQFVNSFLSLFYLAFYVGDMEKLNENLTAVLITRQVLDNIYESIIPFIGQSFKLSKRSKKSQFNSSNDASSMNHQVNVAEIQSYLDVYESTYEDHLEMFIQFGNVILFSSLFPLAGLCALVNNIIEIRSDAFKLCVTHQRPFAGPIVKDIGEWLAALHAVVYIAIIVNCALVVKSGLIQRLFTFMDNTQAQMAGVLLEHLMIALKFILENRLDKSFVSFFFNQNDQ